MFCIFPKEYSPESRSLLFRSEGIESVLPSTKRRSWSSACFYLAQRTLCWGKGKDKKDRQPLLGVLETGSSPRVSLFLSHVVCSRFHFCSSKKKNWSNLNIFICPILNIQFLPTFWDFLVLSLLQIKKKQKQNKQTTNEPVFQAINANNTPLFNFQVSFEVWSQKNHVEVTSNQTRVPASTIQVVVNFTSPPWHRAKFWFGSFQSGPVSLSQRLQHHL